MASPDVHSKSVILSRSDVAGLLDLEGCIAVVEEAFRLHGEGGVPDPGVIGVPVAHGGFHLKAGLYAAGHPYFVAKLNANFMANPRRFGLPGIQGVLLLFDAMNGRVLAVMDSIEITARRTAAATAVAAKYLARADARSVTILGCGTQGRSHLRALTRVLRVERAILFDQDPGAAERMAAELRPELGVAFEVAPDADTAVEAALICVACTPARQPIVHRDAVRPGTFIAAVGADAEGKQEVEAALFADCTIVVDLLEQCASIGDLHHALDAGVVTRAAVHAELGEVVAGLRPGRRDPDERIIFDSTGVAFQDAAAAKLVFERLRDAGGGRSFDFMV